MIRLRSGEVLKLCVILLGYDNRVRAHFSYGHKLDGVRSELCRVFAWALFAEYGRSKFWP